MALSTDLLIQAAPLTNWCAPPLSASFRPLMGVSSSNIGMKIAMHEPRSTCFIRVVSV